VKQTRQPLKTGNPNCRWQGNAVVARQVGNRENWFSALTTRFMLKAVAAVLVTIDRSGQSVLIQIQKALTSRQFKSRWIFSSYQIQLVESMLLECIEDPRPLMRSVLGKDHPLIREAEKNAARPPPETEDEAANA